MYRTLARSIQTEDMTVKRDPIGSGVQVELSSHVPSLRGNHLGFGASDVESTHTLKTLELSTTYLINWGPA